MTNPGLVSFVVLNWNGLNDTLACLDSIRKQTITDYEIIVVDNGSSADQKETLRKIRDIVFIDLPKNRGFTGGQIAAYEKSKGDYIALINNDAVIAPDWADQALASFERYPRAAAVGGKAYLWNASEGWDAFATSNPFYSYQVVNLITGHTRTLQYGETETPVNSISGSGVMISREAIKAVGYFDDKFFAYYEETDLFARFKRAGLRIIYNPGVHTWHKIAQSTRSNPNFYLYRMHRNRFLFAVKNYDRRYMGAFLRYYFKETLRAIAVLARHGSKQRLEEKNLVRAALWNGLHIFGTLSGRGTIKKYGPTYSQTLLDDAGESVSVVIPCYNYADYVGEAIESVLKQTRPVNEIIVINDGSTDESLKAINRYKDRVTIIDQRNSGIVATKNRGLQLAQSDWIIFLDADDIMHEDYVKILYREARQANADVVYSSMKFIGHEAGIFWSRPFSRRALRKGNYINNSALMRKEIVAGLGGYKDEHHFGYEDWELYANLAENNYRFRFVHIPLLFYRRHSDNSRDKAAQQKLKTAHQTIRELHPKLYSKKYELIDFFHALYLFGQRRTPLQALRDIRYGIVSKLDKSGENSIIINKAMGFLRLLGRGDVGTVINKLGLNIKRLFGKAK